MSESAEVFRFQLMKLGQFMFSSKLEPLRFVSNNLDKNITAIPAVKKDIRQVFLPQDPMKLSEKGDARMR